jgi:hypothetical protein
MVKTARKKSKVNTVAPHHSEKKAITAGSRRIWALGSPGPTPRGTIMKCVA